MDPIKVDPSLVRSLASKGFPLMGAGKPTMDEFDVEWCDEVADAFDRFFRNVKSEIEVRLVEGEHGAHEIVLRSTITAQPEQEPESA